MNVNKKLCRFGKGRIHVLPANLYVSEDLRVEKDRISFSPLSESCFRLIRFMLTATLYSSL
ncbi:hypothetical protein HZS_434 [Henneguya salminicola]|nr:hypothetical protein HZS_434 [Henneguya salminicola]